MRKNKRKLRYLATAVSALLCVAALSTVSYATSQDNEPPITSKPEITTAVTTAAETTTPLSDFTLGTPFSEDGIAATRDLLYDANTNKQYITVETRNGHTLYIIIDYDKPLDDEEERYQVYFLNPVDESDLLALLEDEDIEIPVVCTCTDKCAAGNVNADCELCKNNISNCAGKEAATDEPDKTEQTAEESGDSSNGNMTNIIILVVVVALVGGAAVLLLKFRKTKAKPNSSNDLDDFDFEDEDEPEEQEETEE